MNEQLVPFWTGIKNLFVALGRSIPWPGLWVTLAALGGIIYIGTGYARGAVTVTLVVDGTPQQVQTRRVTVGELLTDLDIAVGPWDRLTPFQDVTIKKGMTVAVQHARPVTVGVGDLNRTLYTHGQSVDEILGEAGLTLGPKDKLWVNGQPFNNPSLARESAPSSLRTTSSRGSPRTLLVPISHIQVERPTTVYLHDSGIEQALSTTAGTVGQALWQEDILFYLGDHISPDLNTQIAVGMHIYIQRGKSIEIVVDGQTLRTRTHARTVEEALAGAKIALIGQDMVIPPLDTETFSGMQLRVVRVTEKTLIEQDEIPYETQWFPDSSMEIDQRRVEQAGANGIYRRRYKATYHNGQEVERALEDEWVAQDPQPRRIAYGTQIVVRTLEMEDGSTIEYWRRLRVFLTSYTEATCGKTPDHPWYGKTRIGWKMRHGIIAVDPYVIPMLTEMYVPGYGKGIAADTGGMIKGMHIDLGHEVDNFKMYYWWDYAYLLTPVPPADKIRWVLPNFPKEH